MAPTEGSSMANRTAVDDDQEEKIPISRPAPMSWLPPLAPHDCGDPPPKSVVLDTLVYVDDRTNASTAEGFTSNGQAIYLTFWPAHPPLISYFTVHLPTLLQDGSATSLALLPRLLRTDGDLALFRVVIGRSYGDPDHNNYIIYRAGINKLEVLPTHPTRLFADWSVALLRCPNDGRFLVANLRSTYDMGQYALDLFDSGSGTWSTRSMHTESPEEACYYGTPTKVIALGGDHGSIGWVDLWNGILICDLLRSGDDDDVLRFIRLPVLLAPNKMTPGRLSCDRDVSVGSDGSIKYSEVWALPVPGSQNRATYISKDWGAAILTWLEPKKKWHLDLKLKASDIIVDETHSQLLPQHDVKATTKNPTLSRLHTGHPALSLHDDDVVYIMAKVDHMDDDLWMLAVDMRNKTLKGVAGLTSKRTFGFRFIYLQSDLSNHLVATSRKTEVSNHLVAASGKTEVSNILVATSRKTEVSNHLVAASGKTEVSNHLVATSKKSEVDTSKKTEVSNLAPKSKSSSRRKKKKCNAPKTAKQQLGKTLANSCGVEQEVQELRILETQVLFVR